MFYVHIGTPSYECGNFSTTMWYAERSCKARTSADPTFSICCQDGKVLLPKFNQTPPPLDKLLDYEDSSMSKFRDQIRIYNGMFCFTSFGVRIDHSVNTRRGLYTFRINGQNYHRIGSLLPMPGVQPKYAQLYFFDTQNEARNRMGAFVDGDATIS